jgi:hypothetical protein
VDVLAVVAWRGCLAIYATLILVFLIPLFLTVGAFWLAASIAK